MKRKPALLLAVSVTIAAAFSAWGYVPGVKIRKFTNDIDANRPPGPVLAVGTRVHWTYVVRNTSHKEITGIQVVDDQGEDVDCPRTSLDAGEKMTCTAEGTVREGQYRNVGIVVALQGKDVLEDSDQSHYFGRKRPSPLPTIIPSPGPSTVPSPGPSTVPSPGPSTVPSPGPSTVPSPGPSTGPSPTPGVEGCTPGYWKNHEDSWAATGFSPNQTIVSVFASAALFPTLASETLIEGLDFGGGPGTLGAAQILLRAAVAALLNSAHPDVDYPRTTASVIADVNAALASNDRETMLLLAASLDFDNNLGCPLNR